MRVLSVGERAATMAVLQALEVEKAREAALKLVGKDDPVLRAVAEPLAPGADARELVAGMAQCMLRNRGIGLAAPQVGVSLRVIVGACDARGEGWSFVLLNPVVTRRDKHRVWGREGCLSLPGVTVGQRRAKRVTVEGFNLRWEPVKIKARGLLARVLQHEIDHLDGKLMTDDEEPNPSHRYTVVRASKETLQERKLNPNHDAQAARDVAKQVVEGTGVEVDHASFDAAREYLAGHDPHGDDQREEGIG